MPWNLCVNEYSLVLKCKPDIERRQKESIRTTNIASDLINTLQPYHIALCQKEVKIPPPVEAMLPL